MKNSLHDKTFTPAPDQAAAAPPPLAITNNALLRGLLLVCVALAVSTAVLCGRDVLREAEVRQLRSDVRELKTSGHVRDAAAGLLGAEVAKNANLPRRSGATWPPPPTPPSHAAGRRSAARTWST